MPIPRPPRATDPLHHRRGRSQSAADAFRQATAVERHSRGLARSCRRRSGRRGRALTRQRRGHVLLVQHAGSMLCMRLLRRELLRALHCLHIGHCRPTSVAVRQDGCNSPAHHIRGRRGRRRRHNERPLQQTVTLPQSTYQPRWTKAAPHSARIHGRPCSLDERSSIHGQFHQ